jgi:hypothetical protein
MVFLSGRTDHVVDAPLTFNYLQRISAPQKSLVWFEHSGHYPPFEEPQKFNTWMTERILGLAQSACAGGRRLLRCPTRHRQQECAAPTVASVSP